ncbi:ribonucleoside-diphosphate reductase large chain [Brazilian marseillevirus]|uniref:ribonucleotide reductase n=1 Tax=Brazilian marseillevirus TaxID=1813599 RepID=UPI000784718E|nr:ribonucleotide reductase [Brazilian marseillevirus]AMQ10759.1 ribonucleoside-diphosphate reductase large chain [Brazilian marseillevirus]
MNASQLFDKLSVGLNVQKELVSQMFEKIDASGEDSFLKSFAEVCVFKCYMHPDWGVLAGRAEILRLRDITPERFSDVVKSNRKIFCESYANFVMKNASELDSFVQEDRDMKFDWMAINTLEKSYLLKKKGYDGKLHINERPQQLYLRVATFLCMPDMNNIRRCYNCLSKGNFTMASPTLFNAGLKRPSLSSCFLGIIQDSLVKMAEEWTNIAIISSGSGGLGYSVTPVRHSNIGDIGESSGVVPFLRAPDAILGYVDQAGRRKGSGTFFLACWHVDIFDFVDARKPGGNDLMRAREIFYAIWTSDLFMKRVKEDGQWSLFCPNEAPGLDDVYGPEFEELYKKYENEGKAKKTVRAQELWHHILVAQAEVGMPFIAYKDAICRKSNQKNFGMPHSLNLCVAGDTRILTREFGHVEIESVVNQNIHVWNGEKWSQTKIVKTAENQDLLCVEFSNGVTLQCTPQHRFFVQNKYGEEAVEKRAHELQPGDKLEKWDLPEAFEFDESLEFDHPYTHGFFCGDGTYEKGRDKTKRNPMVTLYHEKIGLLEHLEYTSHGKEHDKKLNVRLPRNLAPKFEVPMFSSVETRLRWFEGYCDADGTVSRNGNNESLQIASIEKDFLLDIRLMLQTLGVESKIVLAAFAGNRVLPDGKGGKMEYECKDLWRLLIGSVDVQKLVSLGFSPKRLRLSERTPQRSALRFVKVLSVSNGREGVDTFCFREEERGRGMFEGMLLGNCMEICQNTSEEEIASCNLATICLPKYFKEGKYDFGKLSRNVRKAVRVLNAVIDRNHYPPEIPKIKSANLKHRPVGLGVQGLADTFALANLSWLDEEAKLLNRQIFETIYHSAITESRKMAEERASFGCAVPYYETFPGSPLSNGFFSHDLWDAEAIHKESGIPFGDITIEQVKEYRRSKGIPESYCGVDWETERHLTKKYGVYNSFLIALPPTASTAQILGNNEAFEPFTAIIGKRTVLSGTFAVVNKHFVNDMVELGIWNKKNRAACLNGKGSIQDIVCEDEAKRPLVEKLKRKYLNAFELSQKRICELSIDRNRYVDQTSSHNCFMKEPTYQKLTSYHFYQWENGAKTGMYYLRTSPPDVAVNIAVDEEEECVMCSS